MLGPIWNSPSMSVWASQIDICKDPAHINMHFDILNQCKGWRVLIFFGLFWIGLGQEKINKERKLNHVITTMLGMYPVYK